MYFILLKIYSRIKETCDTDLLTRWLYWAGPWSCTGWGTIRGPDWWAAVTAASSAATASTALIVLPAACQKKKKVRYDFQRWSLKFVSKKTEGWFAPTAHAPTPAQHSHANIVQRISTKAFTPSRQAHRSSSMSRSRSNQKIFHVAHGVCV